MIIKSEPNNRSFGIIFKILGVALLGVLAYFLIPKKIFKQTQDTDIFCGMEKVQDAQFVSGAFRFDNAHTQSSEKARTGKYSSLVDDKNGYGSKYTMNQINGGDQICAEVWKWSSIANQGFLAVQGNEGSDFFQQTNKIISVKEDWEQIELCFEIPSNASLNSLKIFPYSLNEKGKIYFDDLSIKIKTEESLVAASNLGEFSSIKLYIDQKGMAEIDKARLEALRVGILVNNDQYVNAKLSTDNLSQKVKLRLKGDWTDHLDGNKWSFRIKTDKESAWNRMQTFSLQSPERRFFVKEWLFHNLMDYENLLAPRYDFVWLELNDERPQLYAYEEHFAKHLPESNNRREGVILKFSEDAAWDQRLRSKKQFGNHETILLDDKFNSDILPFKESSIAADSNLMKQFIEGQSLLYAYKHYTKPVDEIFDIDRMAKYYAILEVLNAYHSLVWHNQRFYYNPVSRLLEPIGYDGFIEEAEYKVSSHDCFGYFKSNMHFDNWTKYYSVLFRNEAFAKKYAFHLNQFTEDKYLDTYFDQISGDLNKRVKLIQKDFPSYEFSRKDVFAKAKKIKGSMQAYNNLSLKAYTNGKLNGKKKLSVSNYHNLPIEIIGSGKTGSLEAKILQSLQKVLWSNHPHELPEYTDIEIDPSHNYLYFRVLGVDQIYYSEIRKWPAGNANASGIKLNQTLIPFDKNNFIETEDAITIKSGKYVLDKPLVLTDKSLILESGVEIDLKNKAYIFCQENFQALGTKERPIKIYSSDKTGQGLTVLTADKESNLTYVIFDGLDNLDLGTYYMTGAVSFYEADVIMKHCQFSHNSCEDALNIIRSEFDIDKMHLSHTFSDGFDADFCHGKISNSYSTKTGNDGFDFSGSLITIDNCIFEDIGDKGISAGEQATLTILSTTIDKADIGIAAKDLSKVTIKDISILNCQKAFAAYQKKPEYGPGTINIEKYTAEGNKYLELKEEGSIITFPNNEE